MSGSAAVRVAAKTAIGAASSGAVWGVVSWMFSGDFKTGAKYGAAFGAVTGGAYQIYQESQEETPGRLIDSLIKIADRQTLEVKHPALVKGLK